MLSLYYTEEETKGRLWRDVVVAYFDSSTVRFLSKAFRTCSILKGTVCCATFTVQKFVYVGLVFHGVHSENIRGSKLLFICLPFATYFRSNYGFTYKRRYLWEGNESVYAMKI
jgi:hypothetical protein